MVVAQRGSIGKKGRQLELGHISMVKCGIGWGTGYRVGERNQG